MKLTQDLIVFDLETTSKTNEDGTQSNDNIIQIGAVYLKRSDNKKYEIIDHFNELIKPKDETISPFITELTGISNEMVEDKDYFDVAAFKFYDWVKKNGNIKSTRLCAWGTYFDVPILRKHYQKHNINYPFSGTAYDVKTWACLWMMLSGRRADKLSVETVARIMAITPEGKYHNAHVDAQTTALIALRIFDDLNQGFFVDNDKNGKADQFKITKVNQ
jgi:DNA polymerase III alpha subunit (gram-positive type)